MQMKNIDMLLELVFSRINWWIAKNVIKFNEKTAKTLNLMNNIWKQR